MGREVNFLDLTITINDRNRIETRTYQKPMNLYLYIPEASAHPLGVGKAMVYGSMRRYKLQNTKREHYIEQARLLFRRMKARGWRPSLLKELMMKAANKLEQPMPIEEEKEEVDSSKRFFIHLKYHPRGITRQQVRAAFDDTCDNFRGTAAEVEQVTVALSRPTNLNDELISARLYQPRGRETSTFRPTTQN